MQFSIKNWPEQERPRERLIQYGAESLSDAEATGYFSTLRFPATFGS